MLHRPDDGQDAHEKEIAMPLVRISLREGKSPEFHKNLMEQVYLAMRSAMGTPGE